MASSTEHLTRRFSAIRKICSHFHPKIRLCTKGNFYILEYPVTKRYSGLSPHLAVLLRSQARGQQVDRGLIIDRSQNLLVDQGHPDTIPIQDKVGHPTEQTVRTGTVPCPPGTPTLS